MNLLYDVYFQKKAAEAHHILSKLGPKVEVVNIYIRPVPLNYFLKQPNKQYKYLIFSYKR